jgi:hypothetical protein
MFGQDFIFYPKEIQIAKHRRAIFLLHKRATNTAWIDTIVLARNLHGNLRFAGAVGTVVSEIALRGRVGTRKVFIAASF